jgi:hypothetical protein
MVSNIISDLGDYFTAERRQERCVRIFYKALIAFTLLKVGILWSLSDTFLAGDPPDIGVSIISLILLPSLFAFMSPLPFFIVVTVFLIGIFFIRPNYVTNGILFWIVLNMLHIRYPVTNGSDYILTALCLYTIFFSFLDFYSNDKLEILSISAFNVAHFMARVQILLIYLISGWDKLMSNVWASGEAFQYIGNIETVYNPFFGKWVTESGVSFLLSWVTIIFELGFIFLVWHRSTRLIILAIGTVFHIVIWFMLSLPDFALMMIISYLLFLKDSDLRRIQRWFRPQQE